MKRLIAYIFTILLTASVSAQNSVETQRLYLSGHGCDDMTQWDFYCTGGNRSGRWTKIGVPSCWELQGFGTYQYGMKFYGKAHPDGIANEEGMYKYEFKLPASWSGKQIYLVFEASMTDTKVIINGRKAGDVHQGGFYRFSYDVSDRVRFGKQANKLEVTVSKESANEQVNMAERRADYWNFGGIIRPVFVIAKPAVNISRVAINAGMDGRFIADCYFNRAVNGAKVKTIVMDAHGKTVARSETDARSSDIASIDFKVNNPKLWTSETPNLYTAVFSLTDNTDKVLHIERQKFGFRTIEVRPHDGIYVNGAKVIFKGVNRHSFRPESGRTLSKSKNIEDVNLIKSMNMNAVRLSHYPADPEFLEACDSLGLYVLDELSGWHWAHETIVGQKLVKEMVTRDVNHPSVVFWDNGNEGGFNYELEPEFAKWDIQKRTVLYPWANRNGIETKHYRSYGETEEYMRQPEIFMPTEFLHGLYDGGHGAGLYDYWELMRKNPRCAGGFLWDLADEGVKRVDMDGVIDNVGNYAADGIVGPHHEKEGSYYTVKEVWSPVVLNIKSFGGTDNQLPVSADNQLPVSADNHLLIPVENRYDFLNLNTCKFAYRYACMPKMGDNKVVVVKEGGIASPDVAPHKSGVLRIPACKDCADVLQITATDNTDNEIFTWSIHNKAADADTIENAKVDCKYKETDELVTIEACGRTYSFSKKDGQLKRVNIGARVISLADGPRFIAARRADRSFDQFYNHDDKEAEKKKTQYTLYSDQGTFDKFDTKDDGGKLVLTAKYQLGSLDSVKWTFAADGKVVMDARYNFGGVVDMMGVMFDYPEAKVESKSWVGDGPYRVWQNRLQGPQYGYWQNDYNDPVPGESFTYPEFKGYFANVDWMRIVTKEGRISIKNIQPERNYLGVYQPRDGRDNILYALPESGISLLRVIPAVRNKVNCTDLNGPSAQPYWASGNYESKVVLKFE